MKLMFNVTGIVQRKCIMADMWEENVRCFTEDSGTTLLLDQVNFCYHQFCKRGKLIDLVLG